MSKYSEGFFLLEDFLGKFDTSGPMGIAGVGESVRLVSRPSRSLRSDRSRCLSRSRLRSRLSSRLRSRSRLDRSRDLERERCFLLSSLSFLSSFILMSSTTLGLVSNLYILEKSISPVGIAGPIGPYSSSINK